MTDEMPLTFYFPEIKKYVIAKHFRHHIFVAAVGNASCLGHTCCGKGV